LSEFYFYYFSATFFALIWNKSKKLISILMTWLLRKWMLTIKPIDCRLSRMRIVISESRFSFAFATDFVAIYPYFWFTSLFINL
jgi:hypothetical protein